MATDIPDECCGVVEVVGELRAAREAALRRPHSEIIASIDAWAAAWENPAFPGWEDVRRLPGSSPPVERAILALARSASAESLRNLVQEQLGRPDALEGPVPRIGGGWRQALGFPLVGIFLGGGAALASWPVFLLALIARCTVFARMSGEDQVWPRLFARSLARVDPGLAACIHTEYWPVEDQQRSGGLCSAADVVLAYGSDRAMADIRQFVPASTPFLPFGSRMSVAVIGQDISCEEAAPLVAVDVALYDQGGCLSPQAVLVEGPPARGAEFAHALDRQFGRLLASWPKDSREAGQQAAIRNARGLAAFEEGSLVLGPPDLRWTVLYSRRPAFEPSPLGRTVHVRTFETPSGMVELLRPYSRQLQAAGLASTGPPLTSALAPLLIDMGITRICPPGQMQFPTLRWSHDGRAMLPALVRFIDLEAHC